MEPCTEFEERAAILQFEAGMTREQAERTAREQIARRLAGGEQLGLSFAQPVRRLR